MTADCLDVLVQCALALDCMGVALWLGSAPPKPASNDSCLFCVSLQSYVLSSLNHCLNENMIDQTVLHGEAIHFVHNMHII